VLALCKNPAILGRQEFGRRSEGKHRRLSDQGLKWTPKTGRPDKVWFPAGTTDQESSDDEEAASARAAFKAKVALAAVRGDKTTSQLGVNRKRVRRLMRVMGPEVIYPKRWTSRPGTGHLPLFTVDFGDHAARPVVVEQHYLHPAAARLFVPRSGDGPA
jgi:hypothetical protein